MTAASQTSFSELYSAYAAGCIDPAFAMMLEAQSLLRADIREAIAVSEMISGSFLEAAPAAPMREDALARALAMIDAVGAPAGVQKAAGKAAGAALDELLALPDPVRGPALEAAGGRGWQALGVGIKRLKLDVGSSMEVELYRIAASSKIPRHTHAGPEFTMVLSGGFSDERGNYGPGDVSLNGPSDTHQPIADDDGVCYALVVRDGGLHFTGVMGLIQKMLGAR